MKGIRLRMKILVILIIFVFALSLFRMILTIELLRHPEFVGYLLAQRIHIAANFIVRDFGVYLGSGDMLMP